MRLSSRSARNPHVGRAIRIQPRSPLAWNVPTIGPVNVASAAAHRVGLELRVLDDGAPEGPRVRHDDAHLHPAGHYRRRAVRLRSPHDREILRLALPALGALAAEPLYVLADTAIVGHLGRPQI